MFRGSCQGIDFSRAEMDCCTIPSSLPQAGAENVSNDMRRFRLGRAGLSCPVPKTAPFDLVPRHRLQSCRNGLLRLSSPLPQAGAESGSSERPKKNLAAEPHDAGREALLYRVRTTTRHFPKLQTRVSFWNREMQAGTSTNVMPTHQARARYTTSPAPARSCGRQASARRSFVV